MVVTCGPEVGSYFINDAEPMNENNSKDLEAQISALSNTLVENAKLRLENNQVIIDARIKEAIEIYSNNIRNLGIVSGTVAPFSLSLLSIHTLNVYFPFLLAGFFILLINIVLSQQLLSKLSTDLDKKAIRAQFKHLMAESKIEEMQKTSVQGKATTMFECNKEIDESEKLLGVSKYSTGHWEVIAILRKCNKWINLLFILGACLVMFSTIFESIKSFFPIKNFTFG